MNQTHSTTPKKRIDDIPTEVIHDGSTHRKRLVSADETHNGDISTINYAWLEPEKQLTPHAHPDGEEFYFFLEGTGSMLVGTDWFPVHAGDFVTVARGKTHSLKNTAQTKILFITVRTMERN